MDSPNEVYNDMADISQDLDSLYERLKTVMQAVKLSEVPDHLREEIEDLSHVSASSDCKCKQVFSGSNIRMCNICGEPVAIVNQLLKDKLNFEDEVEILNDLVKAEREEKEKLLLYNQELEAKLEALEVELNKRCVKVQSLEADLNAINTKYIKEIEKLSEVQHSKYLAEEELEELSKKLFEAANKMVADEAKNRSVAELAKERLEDEVMHLRSQLFVQSNLNRDLKRKLKHFLSNPDGFDKLPDLEQLPPDDSDGDAIDLPDLSEDEETLDELQLEQFEAFAANCVESTMNKILQLSFFKRCLEEDIEPCLKFGPSPRIYPRRIVDAIIHNTLHIFSGDTNEASSRSSFDSSAASVPLPANQTESSTPLPVHSQIVAGMWSRWSSVAAQAISSANKISPALPANGCHACGQEVSCRFRIQLVERQEPIPIDKFCRDRIVACLDFFSFIDALRTGQCNARRIDDLYTESLRLRLRMFYARLGFLPTSGIEIPRTLEYQALSATHLAPLLEEIELKDSLNQ